MNYRNAIASDLPLLQQLFTESCPDSDTAIKRRRHLLRAQLIVVAQVSGTVIGFGSLRNNQIDLLYVHQKYQQQGVAEALLSKLGYIVKLSNTTKAADGNLSVRPFFARPHI